VDIPLVVPAANSTDLVAQKKNVFLLNGTGVQQAQRATDFIKQEGSKAVALIDNNASYAKDVTNRTAANLQAAGVKVATRKSVTDGESDYSGAVTAVTKAKPWHASGCPAPALRANTMT
jgi:branched-chain amino acid transport system substrate-binding protein